VDPRALDGVYCHHISHPGRLRLTKVVQRS
jgi:hypothetical protein